MGISPLRKNQNSEPLLIFVDGDAAAAGVHLHGRRIVVIDTGDVDPLGAGRHGRMLGFVGGAAGKGQHRNEEEDVFHRAGASRFVVAQSTLCA